MIISLLSWAQTAVGRQFSGASMVLVGVHGFPVGVSSRGSYWPPVLRPWPPQMIILSPVHTAVCWARGSGAFVVSVSVHVFIVGSYEPPVSQMKTLTPPQTIISLPVQTAVCSHRGTSETSMGAQASAAHSA